MKRTVLSRLIIAAASVFASEGWALAAAPEMEIRAVLTAQAHAWNRGDVDAYMNGYARAGSTQFVSDDTITRGWKTVRDRYAKKYSSREKMGRLSFSDLQITPIGADAAFVVGRWKLERKGDKPRGRFTLLMRRTPEGWRIVHDHTSSASPYRVWIGGRRPPLQRTIEQLKFAAADG